MQVVNLEKLQECWRQHRDVERPLRTWYAEASGTRWNIPNDVLQRYPSADVLPGNRVVFNIKGNHYRLIVQINYRVGIVYVRWVGTHAEYDQIDAGKI